MVLARADRMAARAADPQDKEAVLSEEEGMRLGARYMEGAIDDLSEELGRKPQAEQPMIRKGIVSTLLRNIVLPRDEMVLASSEKAIEGFLSLAHSSGEAASTCQELSQILGQYQQHQDQARQQLEDSIRMQLEQKLAGHPELGDQSALDPTMHPQYREELARIMTDLNDQYTTALDQRKELLLERFS